MLGLGRRSQSGEGGRQSGDRGASSVLRHGVLARGRRPRACYV